MRCRHALVLALLVVSGCSTVTTKSQLGTPLAAEDAKKLEGVWMLPDGDPLWIRHAGDNQLQVAGVEWKDNRFRLVELTAYITADDDQHYVNFTSAEDADAEAPFHFLRIVATDGDYLILAPPKAEAFAAAIERALSLARPLKRKAASR